jgi:prevent-host-death family protein
MTTAGIADLKARLSHYLRGVRRGGQVVVLDRDTPIARIVPYAATGGRELVSRRPPPDAPPPGKVVLPPPLDLDRDVVELLLAERQRDR